MALFAQSGEGDSTPYSHEQNQKQVDSQIPLGQTQKQRKTGQTEKNHHRKLLTTILKV